MTNPQIDAFIAGVRFAENITGEATGQEDNNGKVPRV